MAAPRLKERKEVKPAISDAASRAQGGWRAPVILATFVFLAALAIGSKIEGPVFQLDEGAYLAQASTLAGHLRAMPGAYGFGYSIVTAPAFFLSEEPRFAYLLVRTINALLIGLAASLLCLLSRRLRQVQGPESKVASTLPAMVAALYPAALVFSSTAFSETVLFLLVAAIALAFDKAARSHNPLACILLGTLLGFAFWTHARMGILSVTAPLVLAFSLERNGRIASLALVLLTSSATIATYLLVLEPWWRGLMSAGYDESYGHYPQLSELLSSLTPAGIVASIDRMIGQFLYFNLAGVLLPGVLAAALVRRFQRRGKSGLGDEPWSGYPLAAFLLLSVFSLAALGALSFVHLGLNRLDHWLYGRYLEILLPVTLLVAFQVPGWRNATASALSTLLLAAWLLLRLPQEVAPPVYINLLGLWADEALGYAKAGGPAKNLALWIFCPLAPALIVLALLASARRRSAYALVLVVFSASALAGSGRHLQVSRGRVSPKYQMAQELDRSLVPGSCILLDREGYFDYMEVYAFYFLPFDVRHLEDETSFASCPDAILTLRPEEYRESHPHALARNSFDHLVLLARSRALRPGGERK